MVGVGGWRDGLLRDGTGGLQTYQVSLPGSDSHTSGTHLTPKFCISSMGSHSYLCPHINTHFIWAICKISLLAETRPWQLWGWRDGLLRDGTAHGGGWGGGGGGWRDGLLRDGTGGMGC